MEGIAADVYVLCCSIASTGDPCVQPEGGLGMSGVPRLKLMLTQMQQDSLEVSSDDSAAPAYSRADYAAPEVGIEAAHLMIMDARRY